MKQARHPEWNALVGAVKDAGACILDVQKAGFAVERKENDDIVTRADRMANDILRTELTRRFPDYGWLSEESSDNASRLSMDRVWVVDPIDGTREFATGVPEYAVSVALVEKGSPIAACVYNPATGQLFHAFRNAGAWLDDSQIHCRPPVSFQDMVLLASRSEFKRGEWDRFLPCCHVQPVGSIAYKLALVALGDAHATFSLGPKNEWDIAAGVLLVSEAGGVATDAFGKRFNFNSERVLVDGIVASESSVNAELFAMISRNTTASIRSG